MLLQISTLPSLVFDPPRSLMLPFEQRANEMKKKQEINWKQTHFLYNTMSYFDI